MHNPRPMPLKRLRSGARVSDFYNLGLKQPSLEFLDVTLLKDTKMFVDPRAFVALQTTWGDECVDLIRNFFDDVLQAIRNEDPERARLLLSGLHEPNETRLGLSKERVAGRGVGSQLADSIYASLAQSEAVEHGLIEHLEDTALMIDGIGVDRVSDITTNIVREKLIEFTVEMAEKYDMELLEANSGPIWSAEKGEWANAQIPMLAPKGSPLLLVPRTVARWKMDYDPGEYYRGFVLPFLQGHELGKRRSPLVQTVQSGKRKGERYVRKKDVDRHYRKRLGGGQKRVSVDVTRDYPQVFKQFQKSRERAFRAPVSFEVLHERIGTPKPKWDELLKEVTETPAGRRNADRYHRAIEALLSPLLSDNLVDPKREKSGASDTLRIDVRYRNMARSGFFRWFNVHYVQAPFVPVECKNLSGDPGNEEVAQIAGRLNKHRGRLGFLVCRKIANRERFLVRCRQELTNDRYIIGIDDKNLKDLVAARKEGNTDRQMKLLADLLEELVD
jgi:hypothetical protein